MAKVTVSSIYTYAYILLIAKAFVTVAAFKKTSNVDEYNMVKNHRTRMRQNYVVQNTNEASDNIDDVGIYPADTIDPDTSPEELPALIVDYANMIRNDIILLDNSVQTRTRKRGNVETEKHNQRVRQVPCSCEEDGKKLLILGDDYVPSALESRQCNKSACPTPYSCISRSHNVAVLKKKKYLGESSKEELPADLKRWVTVNIPVIIGCMCSKGYIEE